MARIWSTSCETNEKAKYENTSYKLKWNGTNSKHFM